MGGGTRRRRRIGVIGAAVLAGVVLSAGSGDADTVEAPATFGRQAYYTYPITQITPPVIRNGFPPATACLVAGLVGVPQVCGNEVQQVVALLGLSDGLPILVTPDGDLAQPVAPGTTPIGMLGGQARYASGFQISLPALPAGERFASFELVFHQDGLNFAIESPAVRDVVLQIVSQLEDQDPQLIADAIQRALSGEVPLAAQTITGIEACPTIDPWNGGPAQGAALDGTRVPRVSCLTGTAGEFDAAAGTWTFDLTFAAQAWSTGLDGAEPLANEGILLRPAGAPNLAYGDPDLSTNWIVSLADNTAAAGLRPVIRYSTTPEDSAAGDGGAFLPGDSFEIPVAGDTGFDLGGVPVGGGGSTVGALRARYAEGEHTGGDPQTPGWVWIGLPLLAAGALLLTDALRAQPALARRRPGALTRLELRLDEEDIT
jgi:hypothetical protein